MTKVIELRRDILKYLPVTAVFLLAAPFAAQAATGWQQDGNQNWTYVEDDKKLTNQWVPWSDGTLRYAGGNGLIVTDNWVTYEGSRYRVKEDGTRYENAWFSVTSTPTLPSSSASTLWYYAGPDGRIYTNGWYEIGGQQYYFYQGGNSPRKAFFNLEDKRYYVDENGARPAPGWFSVSGTDSRGNAYTNWYYVQADGSLLRDGWHEVDGKTCYFDANGYNYRNRWITLENGNRRYLGEDGARVTGWQYLEIPDNWSDDEDVEDYINEHGTTYAWFYFSRNGKKKYSSGGKREMNVDGVTYCFDDDGIMHYGWVKLSSTTPEMEGYRYFYEPKSENDQTYILGEKVESAWLNIVGPSDLGGSGVEAWFYLDTSGKPVCGKENDYEVEKIHDDYYVFDMYGEAQYGLIEVDGDFYYCGTEAGDRKCVTGKTSLSDGIDSGTSEYYFDTKGKGITGIKDGSFYYQGKLQKADRTARYEMFDIPGTGRRLVNSSGEIVKGRKVTDGNDQKWEVSSGGAIRVYGSDETAEIVAPEATTSY